MAEQNLNRNKNYMDILIKKISLLLFCIGIFQYPFSSALADQISGTTAYAWPACRTVDHQPYLCVDGNFDTYTWVTPAWHEGTNSIGLDFGESKTVNRIRLWKDNYDGYNPGSGHVDPMHTKNLVIQYTNDTGTMSTRQWYNVTNMLNGYCGTEFLQGASVNSDGTVELDVHDSINEGHGWASLVFDAVTATGLRIEFSTPTDYLNHYKLHEFEVYNTLNDADTDDDGYTTAQGDCNDNDGAIHPDATEACDGKDNDCDGDTDEGCGVLQYIGRYNGTYSYAENEMGAWVVCIDAQGNVFGSGDHNFDDIRYPISGTVSPSGSLVFTTGESGVATFEGAIYQTGVVTGTWETSPGAGGTFSGQKNSEVCDCTDTDSDHYFAENGCLGSVDCDDNNSGIHPGATEICDDGIDQDCDGQDDQCPPDPDDVKVMPWLPLLLLD